MHNNKHVLGVDIGSVSISIVELSESGDIVLHRTRLHGGDVRGVLAKALDEFDIRSIGGIAQTASSPSLIRNAVSYDSHVSLIRGVRKSCTHAGSILYVGGERFGLIEFDEHGEYRRSRVNSSCAAGTGSFLDQQAKRLSLSGIEEFCEIASSNSGNIPMIASRCAVFAKTDLIHAQQEGYTLAEICDGLCMGLARNIVDTLFASESVAGPIVMAGGVGKNAAVVRHLESLIKIPIVIDELSQVYGAMGAGLSLLDSIRSIGVSAFDPSDLLSLESTTVKEYFYPPLELKMSTYPSFESVDKFNYSPTQVKTGIPVEVDIYQRLVSDANYECFLGIDIGSTSTKGVLTHNNDVLMGLYTRTSGRPLDAV
ncbi:MAG TPA: BadF/BadG/BcrA/BcrD ATPase family protein, partial [Spirochaetota bacterium]